MKFSRSTWSAVAVVLSSAATTVRGDTAIPDTLENYNITECALGIAASISSPTCNATQPCVTFVTSTIPRCESLHNDPGCWCGNHDPLHYCAQCMSSPTDNTTSADQMEQAVSNHRGYHIYCATYAKILNGTEPNPADSAQNSGGSKTNVGAIAGGVVGGVVVVALIAFGVWFAMKKRAQRRMSPSREFMSQQNTGNGPSISGRGSVFSSSNGGKSQFGGSSNPGSPAPMMGLAYNSPTPASFNPYAPSGSPGLSNNGHPMSPGTGSQYGGTTAGSRNSQALGYDTSMLSHLSPPAHQGSFPPVAEQMDYSTPAPAHYTGNR